MAGSSAGLRNVKTIILLTLTVFCLLFIVTSTTTSYWETVRGTFVPDEVPMVFSGDVQKDLHCRR